MTKSDRIFNRIRKWKKQTELISVGEIQSILISLERATIFLGRMYHVDAFDALSDMEDELKKHDKAD